MLKRKTNADGTSKMPLKKFKSLPVSPPSSDFPSDVLRWMKENAAGRMSLKLMKICKYFQYEEFPYFVARDLTGFDIGWKYLSMSGSKFENIDLETVSKKIWISDDFCIRGNSSLMDYCFPKIIVVDIYYLILAKQSITFEQFTFLGKKVKFLELEDTFIKNVYGENIPLEDILQAVPNIEDFTFRVNGNYFVSHQDAIKKVPTSLKIFRLLQINENFNFEECFKFIQKRQEICMHFQNDGEWSIDTTKHVQLLTDNLIQAWLPPFNKAPIIYFQGRTEESRKKLSELDHLHNIYYFSLNPPRRF